MLPNSVATQVVLSIATYRQQYNQRKFVARRASKLVVETIIANVHELEILAKSMMGKRVLTLFWLL
jgi:aminoglycoside phosphotransferase (APT) family kinase protein